MSAKNRITINLDDKNYDELTVLSEKLDVSLDSVVTKFEPI